MHANIMLRSKYFQSHNNDNYNDVSSFIFLFLIIIVKNVYANFIKNLFRLKYLHNYFGNVFFLMDVTQLIVLRPMIIRA